MKKIILIICTIICFNLTYAQDSNKKVSFYATAGVSISNICNAKSDLDTSSKIGGNINVLAEYNFTKGLYIQGGLTFTTSGFKNHTHEGSGDGWQDDGANYDLVLDHNYTSYNLQIPIYIAYKLKVAKNLFIGIKAGPYVSYALGGNLKTKGYHTYYDTIHSSETESIDTETKLTDIKDLNRFDYGITGGIEVGYKRYVLSAIYQYGFGKKCESWNYGKDATENNIMISVGYKF